ncbi:hypothetical protein BT96DRAFT_989319 [Gymnopus androsaceus JB14]|uniref:F-box domain-containing protein n=1 Tax=Gymnopus androsaceus JB14 TaxID=1447944 RepID=A0A6A4HYM4_9AGAR|nr:hypothetical protein BT96DRAFT_989319 [Gymnopus androsaceus JB14]
MIDIAQCSTAMKEVFEVWCSNLTDLGFRQFPDDGAIKLCSPPISTPFVRKLTLVLRGTSHPEPERLANVIFASLTCPSLTSLFIEDVGGYKHMWPRDVVNDFISRSSFSLTTLSIMFIPLLDSHLIDLLHRLPSLLHLTINDSDVDAPSPITPRFIESLHAFYCANSVTLSSTLMKGLQSLSLTFTGEDFDDRLFVDMVSSRWFPPSYADGLDSRGQFRSVATYFK